MPKLIECNTARLRLRQWLPADREPFARLSSDPRVMEVFQSSVLDRAASDAKADHHEKLIAERGWGFWAVEVTGDEAFIGFVGLNIPSADLPFSPCVEIGWRLAFHQWGKGYATEAARAALAVAFDILNVPEIVSFTTLLNARSQAVMSRLGMHKDAEKFDHPDVPIDSRLRRHCLYRLSRGQWRASSAGVTAVPSSPSRAL